VLTAAASATTTTAKPTSSSSFTFLFIIILIGVGGYLLFVRPRSQAMRRQQAAGQQFAVGDRVLTRAGIVGIVRGFNGDRVQLEISAGVVIEVVRQGIGQKLPDELEDDELIPPPPGADELHDDSLEGEHVDDDGEDEHEVGEPAEWGEAVTSDDPTNVDDEDPTALGTEGVDGDEGKGRGRGRRARR
jgi:preprotein translocase YajC subunit